MAGQKKQGSKHAPLSPEARAWEAAQLRALGLTDVVWEASVCCPRCRSVAEQPLRFWVVWPEASLNIM
jgi:hypothetical protein